MSSIFSVWDFFDEMRVECNSVNKTGYICQSISKNVCTVYTYFLSIFLVRINYLLQLWLSVCS